jgi:hypothetical protein
MLTTNDHKVTPLCCGPGQMDTRPGLWKGYVTGDSIFNPSRQEESSLHSSSNGLWWRLQEEKQEIKGMPAMVQQDPAASHLRI